MSLPGTLGGILFAQPFAGAADNTSIDRKHAYVSGYARIRDISALPYHRTFQIVGRAKVVRKPI